MRIIITTEVASSHKAVSEGFNEALFLALKPPLMPLKLHRFDGCEKGDEVHIELGIAPLSQKWNALIVEHGETDQEIYFVDRGVELPFFLKTWEHRHRIVALTKGRSQIIDDFDYTTPIGFMDYLMYPIIYLQFWLRKPVYRRIFGK